jgi:pilus assembly protein Flp/PilA
MIKFLKDDRGATAIEYCLIGAAMSIMLVTSFPAVSTALSGKFSGIGPAITAGK